MEWKLRTYGGEGYDGFYWFSNNLYNGLFRMNIETGFIELVDFFPNEDAEMTLAHKKCILVDGKLFFIPAYGNNIQIYDLNDKKFLSLPIERDCYEFCADAALYEDKIYIFPYNRKDNLMVLDTKNMEIKEISSFRLKCEPYHEINDLYTLCRVSVWNGKAYFAFWGKDIIASFDLHTEELTIFHVGIQNLLMCHMNSDGCWLVTREGGNIYLYDFVNSSQLIYSKDFIEKKRRSYNQVFTFANRTWFIPAYAGITVSVDEQKKTEIHTEFIDVDSNFVCLFGVDAINNEIWLPPFFDNDLYTVNIEGSINRKYPFTLQDKHSKGRILARKFKNRIMEEESDMNLEEYLLGITFME